MSIITWARSPRIEAISFAKIRGGYSQVAGGANNPYGLGLTYGLVGQGHLGNPLGSINGGVIPNAFITPFEKNETEIGLDLKLFDNKLSVDFAYYSNQTLRDIVNAATSPASGFNSTTINLGEITNKGVELLVNWRAIDKGDLALDLSFNYTNNKSLVVSTDENNGIIPFDREEGKKHLVRYFSSFNKQLIVIRFYFSGNIEI